MINSLEDAIKHCEEVAKRQETNANSLKNGDDFDKSLITNCLECANEHRHLAEWLRELKAYRDGCHCDTCKYLDENIRPCRYCGDNASRWEYGGGVNANV